MEKTHIPAYVLEPAPRVAAAPVFTASRAPMPDFIKDIEAGRVQLPMIQRIAQRVTDALAEPEIDFDKVSRSVARDPVLSAKVLRVANSSLTGDEAATASIDAAVARLGAEALSRLIETSSAATALDGVVGIDLRLFWYDALLTAVAAHKLARLVGADPEEAYLTGLLHTSGHLILCRCYPDIAEAMFSGFRMTRGVRLAAVEKDAFGTDHPTAGALWVESLNFPPSIVEAIRTQLSTLVDQLTPLSLALRNGRLLATAVLRKSTAEEALTKLAPELRERFTASDGRVRRGFVEFYGALQEIRAK